MLRRLKDEQGSTWVVVALFLPVAIVLIAFVIDIANWYVHQRHLQTQVDAAAFAGGGKFAFPNCSDSAIETEAAVYSGDLSRAALYNQQVAQPGKVKVLFNSATYPSQGGTADDTDPNGGPCAADYLDVKATDQQPSLFLPVFGLLSHDINAHSRISFVTATEVSGSLPLSVPDPSPRNARAYFVNEATGAVLTDTSGNPATVPLFYNATASGLDWWSSNDARPAPKGTGYHTVTLALSTATPVGIRIALSGSATNDQCGQGLVVCYDNPSAPTTPSGIEHFAIYNDSSSPSSGSPAVSYAAELVPSGGSSCTGASFLGTPSSASSCSFDLNVGLSFLGGLNTNSPKFNVQAQLNGGGTSFPMAKGGSCPGSSGTCWHTTSPISASLSTAGSQTVDVSWADTDTADTLGASGPACKSGGSNPCKGTLSAVQRTFVGGIDASGPLADVEPLDTNGLNTVHTYAGGSTVTLGVQIATIQGFASAGALSAPVTLRLASSSGSQTYATACNPNSGPYKGNPTYSSLSDELAHGCILTYEKNTGQACPGANAGTAYPGSTSQLWNGSAPPWNCVAVTTGGTPNEVAQGLNQRILGDPSPSSCTHPNWWNPAHDASWSATSLDPGDPRIVTVMLSPFGSFQTSGNQTYPVTRFATFYITGWAGSGGGFANPCQSYAAQPDDTAPAGAVVGHFMTYAESSSSAQGTDPCDQTGIDVCVAELTQ